MPPRLRKPDMPLPSASPISGPRHHPDEALLLRYASGEAPAPLALILAAHVAMCAICRATVRQLEAVGGALLAEAAPLPVSDTLLAATLARLDAGEPPPVRQAMPAPAGGLPTNGLPGPLHAAIGRPLAELPWRRHGRAVSRAMLMAETGGFVATLLRVAPGTALPVHTHRGTALTLLLGGGLAVQDLVLKPGDLLVTDKPVTRRPLALPGDECLCLTATQAPPRFEGPLGPILNYISRR